MNYQELNDQYLESNYRCAVLLPIEDDALRELALMVDDRAEVGVMVGVRPSKTGESEYYYEYFVSPWKASKESSESFRSPDEALVAGVQHVRGFERFDSLPAVVARKKQADWPSEN